MISVLRARGQCGPQTVPCIFLITRYDLAGTRRGSPQHELAPYLDLSAPTIVTGGGAVHVLRARPESAQHVRCSSCVIWNHKRLWLFVTTAGRL